MAGIPAKTDPLVAVRSLAEAAAQQRGSSLAGSGLRLFAEPVEPSGADNEPLAPISPFDLGRTYELLLAPATRRKTGSHLTPEAVARNLVALLPSATSAHRVLDPAVGGAAFLLAAADSLVGAGADPGAVVDQLFGFDIDPGAVAVAEAAIAIWGLDHHLEPRALPGICEGDGLLRELPKADWVVGNPPFLNQLRSSSSHTTDRRAQLRERWGDLVTTYTDDAWLFLAAGLDALTADGSLVMVQPISILAARHGEGVRRHVEAQASLTGLWVARDQVFDAAVQVCGLAITRGDKAEPAVSRSVGADFSPITPLKKQPSASGWGSAAATTLGVPTVHLRSGRTVGEIATATAGFRDQFYGFVPFVSEHPKEAPLDPATAPLITVGMIDVLRVQWGERIFKFAKQPYERPVIDLAQLRADDPALGEWADARLRPKVLMATQTRVVEVWVDEEGIAVPATPVLSIEPLETNSLWLIAAALSAPAVSAHLQAAKFGTAMSINAMKIAARDVLDVPLPKNTEPWQQAAELIRSNPDALTEFAELMARAYGTSTTRLTSWWFDRIPNRSETSGSFL